MSSTYENKSIFPARTSLVDTSYQHCVDIWAVFLDMDKNRLPAARSRFWSFLEPGFQHVECWKFVAPGAWLRFDTSIELTMPEVYAHPPWQLQARLNPTCIRIQRLVPKGEWRERFYMGPMTCVESAKAFLGVSGFFIRTPWQLFKHLRKQSEKC